MTDKKIKYLIASPQAIDRAIKLEICHFAPPDKLYLLNEKKEFIGMVTELGTVFHAFKAVKRRLRKLEKRKLK